MSRMSAASAVNHKKPNPSCMEQRSVEARELDALRRFYFLLFILVIELGNFQSGSFSIYAQASQGERHPK